VIRFTVLGKSQPAGSKRGFPRKGGGVRITDANREAGPWKATVANAALLARLEGLTDEQVAYLELLEGPLALTLRFYLTRPKGHYGKKGLRPSAPEFPTVRPDVLKLARAIEDALTGTVWRDDAQIVQEEILKLYGEPARVEVEVYELSNAQRRMSSASQR
jgi:Holliday junction resolvase RusA-like endonuclease